MNKRRKSIYTVLISIMELFKITKSKFNVCKSKHSVVFHLKEENGGEEKHYEFEFSKINQNTFSIRCKKCKCHLSLPNIGIKIETTFEKNNASKISSAELEENLLKLENYGQPFHNHSKWCIQKCTAEHKGDCSVHQFLFVQRRFRTCMVQTALQVFKTLLWNMFTPFYKLWFCGKNIPWSSWLISLFF